MNTRKGRISAALSDEINSHRARLAPFFNGNAKPNPSVSFANDGTGFGKSYNVFDQFIEHAEERDELGGHRNLFFITPHKAQIDISKVTQEKAAARGVSILSFLAERDLSDLSFVGWVSKVRNEDLYASWSKALYSDYYHETVNELSNATSGLKATETEQARYLKSEVADYLREAELERRIDAAKQRLLHALQDLAKAVIREKVGFEFVTTQERFLRASNDRERAKIQVVDHVLPFERAKVGPTIFIATTARFLKRAFIVYLDKKREPNIKKLSFEEILGAKRPPTNAEEESIAPIGAACSLPHDEQITYLKEDFFVPDESNYFKTHGITFNLVIDEEHDSYDRVFEESKKKLVSEKVKPPHVIAGLHRLMEMISAEYGPEDEEPIAFNETVELMKDLRRHYEEDCETSVSLDSILQMCSGNVGHITINNRDVEQILALSQNIFSLTPRRFYNEAALKRIRMRSVCGKSEIRLSFDDGAPCSDPTLHDFLQVMLCALYACSKIPQDSPLRHLLELGEDASQNAPLSEFIKKSRQHRSYVASVFDRAKDAEIFVDAFFTFFAPKIVFSLVKVNEIPFGGDAVKNRVFVDFHLDLILELPEVKLLRVLHGTQNSAMCLSATTGFKHSYSGNFSRKMLARYGEAPSSNLDVRVVQRSQADVGAMSDLRTARAKARTMEVRPFHKTSADDISGLRSDPVFKSTYRFWSDSLLPPGYRENKYRMSAYRRQIEAMLMAAWDEKNTFVLSLNNRFAELFKNLFAQGIEGRLKGLRCLYQDKIFELKPFEGKTKIRVILFSSQLAREVDIDQYLKVDDDTRICLISAYGSAGTGLNLFVERAEDNFHQDFDRLVLVNTPFYSAIREKDTGLNTVKNHILLLKHISSGESEAVRLAEFDSNLMQPKNRRILNQEHDLAVLKAIIQAVGRVERRDTLLHTEIFLPSDVIDDLIVRYSRLRREGNDLLINSLSLLNHKLMQFCLQQAESRCFATQEEREQFTTTVAAAAGDIEDFFSGVFRNKILRRAREGDRDAMELNEMLRSQESITAPEKYVRKLLTSPLVKASGYYQGVISTFYLPRDVTDRITVCTTLESFHHLSDLLHGHAVYQPGKWLVPDYVRSDSEDHDSGPGIINLACNMASDGIDVHLPNPALIPLLKGNVGEFIFSKVLSTLGVKPLNLDQLISLLGPAVYERYDTYVHDGDTLICIDVKRWSGTLNNQELSLKTLHRAETKRQEMYELCSRLNLRPRFLYVNTQPDDNDLNAEREFNFGESIHFLNAFKMITKYVPVTGTTRIHRVDDRLMINPTLVQLLRNAQ
ncbi:hypothetical protein C1Y08_01080 [Pseudomonas sp. FW306-02-F02-AA]|uniref:Uncharacterized protein n=1 Tax=Pseudomonas fluorescens TaxID=294 RepID=A0A0N9VZE0_PSEFL|nr:MULTISPECIES: hypothetical protein [Pseudomonas]ALI04085.1 hypothetical protein AO353_24580 [Pseudomonas fluorescens]PMZ02168.1 hypothetical protein C1Y07_21525 [Pseudomonas sp. FW306-02-F02-AB]PMZ07849.1 hypothetical protein C1Y06_22460 [Pseudomonas sp. FW306-02-H06C]PMZ17933.1 hypothetical protein C1Y08_01080 [Pseudomonas sp. FW306-02-F02-AA]PMZ23966.1 hypothetical protein C1Y09_01085 [Pseudomonas sp. FW306-02-F08-AA]